jgi:DNA gyrase subunit B
VWRQQQHFQQRFAYGKPLGDMTSELTTEHRKGTRIRFKYDSTIFSPDVSFDLDVISRRLQELAFLNDNATLNFKALSGGDVAREESFHYDGGIAAYVEHITADAPKLHDCMHFKMFQDNSEVCSCRSDALLIMYTALAAQRCLGSLCHHVTAHLYHCV